MHLKERLKKNAILLLLLCGVVAIVFIVYKPAPSIANQSADFQSQFSELEQEIDDFTSNSFSKFRRIGNIGMMRKEKVANEQFLHIYCNDSLIYWNANTLPVYSFAELHFPEKGMIQLQNGWYFVSVENKNDTIVVGSFCIQQLYPYQNDDLKNGFNSQLTDFKGSISLDKKAGIPIRDKNNKYLFSLVPTTESETEITASSPLFDPTLLALGEWIPHFAALIAWSCIVVLILFGYWYYLKRTAVNRFKYKGLLSLAFIPFLAWWMGNIAQQMVENSSIPLQLDQFFTLNIYSFIVLILIGIVGLGFTLVVMQLVTQLKLALVSNQLVLITFTTGCVLVGIISFGLNNRLNSFPIWPVALSGLLVSMRLFLSHVRPFTHVVTVLFLFAVITTTSLRNFAVNKERAERELYASQLANDKDINAEIEYATVSSQFITDKYWERYSDSLTQPRPSEVKEAMERRFFNGYWERYDVDIYVFNKKDTSTLIRGKNQGELIHLIQNHGEISELDSNLFLIKDYKSQFSYVGKEYINVINKKLCVFITFKSKLIPEEIGFPRLLISDKAKVLESLENYSIAKYHNNVLTTNYGTCSFPYEIHKLFNKKSDPKLHEQPYAFFTKDGYDHYVLFTSDRNAIFLSKQQTGWLDAVTTMAFLFVIYGLFIGILALFYYRKSAFSLNRISLAVKIQLVLVGLVVASLVAFSWGSSAFVSNQYADYSNSIIREKLQSVGDVATLRLGEETTSIRNVKAENVEYYLQNWARIFVTDVNLYDLQGQLVGSSSPKIYNIGLVGEQMNPQAMVAMQLDKQSEYVHEEQIGDLTYLSGYFPFFNNEGKLLAYFNLQYFDQQHGFEHQVQRFLVAIINIFMLLLALSIVIALLVSNWLTSPLRMIQRNFARVEFGKNNQAIDYQTNDEIGGLVREYNQKLIELEIAANQLAQTERESAWREMAKQVAHEIKNPLTPMKLSIQQLQRVFDPNDPQSKQKIDRVAQSIIDQIDALTSIANAFSNFAKLPKPQMVEIELNSFLSGIVAVFETDDLHTVTYIPTQQSVLFSGDKEMLIRVINNLITNAIQSIPVERKGNIEVVLSQQEKQIRIAVKDNGKGIPAEQIATVFEPYFTTKSTGTGLGLAMVKQIIQGHGGTIRVAETSEQGTVMEIIFFR